MSTERSKHNGLYDFRQGTTNRLEASFYTFTGELAPQTDMPVIEILYIDLTLRQPATSIPPTSMYELEPGRYYYDWFIPLDEPTISHQVLYRGVVSGVDVVGEDIVTVLPATSQSCCFYTPTVLTTGATCYSSPVLNT